MNITILGAGRVANALGARLLDSGHEVTLFVRQTGQNATSLPVSSDRSTIAAASIVINATPGETALEYVSQFAPELTNTILIDVSNAVARNADGSPGGLLYTGESLAERLQNALPDTSVVKTLNTMLFSAMADPTQLPPSATVFMCGDNPGAKHTVQQILNSMGWQPPQILDLGPLATARATEAAILLATAATRATGFVPMAISAVRA